MRLTSYYRALMLGDEFSIFSAPSKASPLRPASHMLEGVQVPVFIMGRVVRAIASM